MIIAVLNNLLSIINSISYIVLLPKDKIEQVISKSLDRSSNWPLYDNSRFKDLAIRLKLIGKMVISKFVSVSTSISQLFPKALFLPLIQYKIFKEFRYHHQ